MLAIHIASAALFVATGILLLVAELSRFRALSRVAVLSAFVTVLGADALLLANVPEIGGLWAPSGRKAPPRKQARHGADDDGDYAMAAAASGVGRERDASAADIDGGSPSGGGWASGGGVGSRLSEALAGAMQARTARQEKVPGDVIKDCADCPEVVVLPPGRARNAEIPAPMSAVPPSEVNVWPGFAIGRREIARFEFDRFLAMTGRASLHGQAARPADRGERNACSPCRCVGR